jgi:hypothetical protein
MTGATAGSSPSTGINNVGTRTFNVGTTTVTYTAKDAAGNSATCSFSVTVKNSNCHGLPVIAAKLPEPFSVQIMNNPSLPGTDFIISTRSVRNENITIKVFNARGVQVYQAKGVTNQSYRFGASFISGMYIVQVLHGTETGSYKIIKGN